MFIVNKTGWLRDKNGNQFAPKTIVSSVYDEDGVTTLKESVNASINTIVSDPSEALYNFAVKNGYQDSKENFIIKFMALLNMDISNSEPDTPPITADAGLYRSGSNYTELLKTWNELVTEGILNESGNINEGQETMLEGDLILPNTLTLLPETAYMDCTLLSNIVIPDTITSMGDGVFYGCSSLEAIIIPDSVTTFGHSMFRDCEALTSAKIGNGVLKIQTDTFSGCTNLTEVIIGTGVQAIEDEAFKKCSSLESIDIPITVQYIDSNVFKYCNKLIEEIYNIVYVDKWVLEYGSSLLIGNIKENVVGIAANAFYGSGVKEISLPSSIKYINDRAFKGSQIEQIYIYANNPPILGEEVFISCEVAAIYVPDESVTAYKTADGWSAYANLIKGFSEAS